ncbi:MAG: hypothetical protein KHW52_02440 [Clostridium sp.]|jgi:hypothetical protein|nr:hypothetical protein [Clostridium sp.]
MKKEILKKILLSLFFGVMAFGIIGTVSVFASCDVANYRYGSSPVTAYGKCEGIKDDGRGWNNHLEVQCIGYQIKNDGKTYTENGGKQIKDNASSVESRIWVDWGRGTTYTNTYSCYCRYCGTSYGTESHTFAFSN